MNLRTIYFETISVDGGVYDNHRLTLPTDASNIQQIIITVESLATPSKPIFRFRCDGSDVSSTIGVPMNDGDTREISDINDIINFSYMNIDTNALLLHIEYFGIDN